MPARKNDEVPAPLEDEAEDNPPVSFDDEAEEEDEQSLSTTATREKEVPAPLEIEIEIENINDELPSASATQQKEVPGLLEGEVEDKYDGSSLAIATMKEEIPASLEDEVEYDGLSHYYSLPQHIIDGVETFTFFIGYSRSGSSIVSSLMDAHPNMIVAYQYEVFDRWNSKLADKEFLYNTLYEKSQKDARTGWRSEENLKKGYSLYIGTGWQGRYDQYLSVIGDKQAAETILKFRRSPDDFLQIYTELQETVKVPIKVVFVIRNPYDIISTLVLYQHDEELQELLDTTLSGVDIPRSKLPASDFKSYMIKLKNSSDQQAYEDAKFRAADLETKIQKVAEHTSAISQVIDIIGSENVWQVHNMDLVEYPKATLMEMCEFFNIYCSEDYLQTCADSVFKSVFKSRDLVFWPEREKQLVIDDLIKVFPFFDWYTFESD